VFEVIQSFGAPAPAHCDNCGASSQNLTKLISPSQVVFKGSGFYLTDNRGAKNSSLDTPQTTEPSSEPVAATTENKETKTTKTAKEDKSKD
jgi:predicted nucleic acid-binding Zn ribbon protein